MRGTRPNPEDILVKCLAPGDAQLFAVYFEVYAPDNHVAPDMSHAYAACLPPRSASASYLNRV